MAQHYINNKQFLAALVDYKKKCKEATEANKPLPKVPNYIGECILLLATRWTSKPSYANYPFRDEMISDAIENCFLYMHNFNEEKTQNPFAYFTQIIKFACWRRIDREKKQLYVKMKSAQKSPIFNDFYEQQKGDDFKDVYTAHDSSYANDFTQSFEKQLKDKKEARKMKQNSDS